MGGISGHAGLFSTVDDLITVSRSWLFAPPASSKFLNSTTTKLFITQHNHSLSSRAIGWNTNSPDAPDHGWEFVCGTLSPRTFLHTGYTGTMMCLDPDRGVGVVLLTHRVYPEAISSAKIHEVRKQFTTKVQQIVDAL
jgi:CubicO group peptidase (beta-lactamase class C family)